MSKAVLIGSVSLLVLLLIGVGVVLYLQSQQSKTPSPNPSGTPPSGSPPSGSPPSGTPAPSPAGCAASGAKPCPTATKVCVVTDANPTGVCRECGTAADCAANQKCSRNKCMDELKCYYNEDCTAPGKDKCLLPAGGTLGTTLGTCVECNSNSTCPSGKVCYNGVCTLIADVPPISCTTNTDCANDPKGQTKCLIPSGNLSGTCKTCAKDTDCPDPLKKKCGPDGTCYGCLSNTDCQSNFVCQNPGTSTAVCVEKGCAKNSECDSGEICAYPGTTFAKCVSLCTKSSDCTEAGLRNCWGYENGAITQYKFKQGGPNYCVGDGPQKCCWNRWIQNCASASDCDGGGEGCVNNGTVTQQYGKATCDTCQSRGMIMNESASDCVQPYTSFDNMRMDGHDLRTSPASSAEECAKRCVDSGDCTHYAFRKNDKVCWQKRPGQDPNFEIYFKHPNGFYTHADGFRTGGGDYLDRGSTDSAGCRAKCDEYGNQCFGYMLQKGEPGSCWLHRQYSDTNHISGNVRRSFP